MKNSSTFNINAVFATHKFATSTQNGKEIKYYAKEMHVFLINQVLETHQEKLAKKSMKVKNPKTLFMFPDQIKREIDLKRLYGRNLDCDFDFSASRRSLFNESKG